MTSGPRDALDRLISALQAHLAAAEQRRGEADPAVVDAYQSLADAFEAYDEALYDSYDEVTPFVLYDDAEDALEDDEELDDDEEDDDLDDDDEDDDLAPAEEDDLDELDDDLDDDEDDDPDEDDPDEPDTGGDGVRLDRADRVR